MTWKRLLRIGALTAILLLGVNQGFAALLPMEAIGRLSLYGWLIPYRERLPNWDAYQPYNSRLTNIPALFAAHAISRPRADDEFRVVVLGDSGTWGSWVRHDRLATAAITAAQVQREGRRVIAYNLGYSNTTLTKDVVILDEALRHDPDLVIWNVTLYAFDPAEQIDSGLVLDNPERMRRLIACCGLNLPPYSPHFREQTAADRTLIGQRTRLLDLLQLQLSGFAWSASNTDLIERPDLPRMSHDLEADLAWLTIPEPLTLTRDVLAFDALEAGRLLTQAAGVPLWISNEPIFVASGANSDLRYNIWYPRWAYDQYRVLLADYAAEYDLPYLDIWDAIDPALYTDSPAHLNAAGHQQWGRLLADWIATEAGP